MRREYRSLVAITIFTVGCSGAKITEDTGQSDSLNWYNADEGEDSSSDSDSDTDTESSDDKPEDTGFSMVDDCAEGFDPTASCEGTWEETICMYDGLIWWCQDGIWTNEDEKPD